MTEPRSENIDFEKTATYLLARVATAYRNAMERHMGKIDLHGGQVFVLIELWKKDGLRQVDIAERLNLKPPTVNKMIKALMEINLVTRERVDNDARSSRIYLTKRGVAMRDKVNGQWVELESDYLSGLTETERHILLDLLAKLRIAYTGRKEDDDEE